MGIKKFGKGLEDLTRVTALVMWSGAGRTTNFVGNFGILVGRLLATDEIITAD